jgi:hypothetical protein
MEMELKEIWVGDQSNRKWSCLGPYSKVNIICN